MEGRQQGILGEMRVFRGMDAEARMKMCKYDSFEGCVGEFKVRLVRAIRY